MDEVLELQCAIEAATDAFLSFDADQQALAESAGLPLITLASR